jgi:hypothetical protein
MPTIEPTCGGESPEVLSPDAPAIRTQLERLLANPYLCNSKRCQALLGHIVETALAGSVEHLKERALGCDVFHRQPDYDTNQDSIVRTTAAEIRKRLAQYYLEPGHDQELRISLPAGSYVPEFRAALGASPPVAAAGSARPRRHWYWALAVAAPLVLLSVWLAPKFGPSTLSRFWQPVLGDGAEAVICVGQPSRVYWFQGERTLALNEMMVGTESTAPAPAEARQKTSVQLSELRTVGERYFMAGDVMASMRLAEMLGREKKSFRVLGERAATYRDLRGKPLILIGLSNNKWSLGLVSQLRYYFERHVGVSHYEIRDRQTGQVVAAANAGAQAAEEFAIVSRVFDRAIEKTVVVVAGVGERSTGAASEFLTNEAYLRAAFASAPSGWHKRNIQVVLKTELISGTAGPPTVVEKYFW